MAAVHDKTILEGSSKKIKNSNIKKNRKISIKVIKLQCLLSWVQNCFLLGLILARSCLHLCFLETFRRDESISGHLVSSPSFARRRHSNDRLDIRWHMIQSSLLKISAIWNRFLDMKFEKMWWLVMYIYSKRKCDLIFGKNFSICMEINKKYIFVQIDIGTCLFIRQIKSS